MKDQFQILSDIADKLFAPGNLSLSVMLTATFGGYTYLSNTTLFGVSVLFIVIVCGFMVVDWFMGTYASVAVQKDKFQSRKLTYTIMKFVTFFMWIFLITQIKNEIEEYAWAVEIVSVIHVFVLILITLREFVSIGEKMEIIWGTKPYLFTLIDSVFLTLEKLFKKKLEEQLEGVEEIIEQHDEQNQEL